MTTQWHRARARSSRLVTRSGFRILRTLNDRQARVSRECGVALAPEAQAKGRSARRANAFAVAAVVAEASVDGVHCALQDSERPPSSPLRLGPSARRASHQAGALRQQHQLGVGRWGGGTLNPIGVPAMPWSNANPLGRLSGVRLVAVLRSAAVLLACHRAPVAAAPSG